MSDIGEIALLVGVPVGFVILFGILLKYGDKKADSVTNVTGRDESSSSGNSVLSSQGSFASSYNPSTIEEEGSYRPSEGGGRRRSAKTKRSSHRRRSKSKNRK